MLDLLNTIYAWLWGTPLLLALLALGVWFTIRLRGLQFRHLLYGLRLIVSPPQCEHQKGDVSHFQALMMALAATIGIGNIAGVATALSIGGLGALFWLWVITMVGLAIKYAEAVLSVKYRITDHYGEMAGGPMYYIERGLGWKKTASLFALITAVSAFGGGNLIQANSVADALDARFGVDPWISAIVMMVATAVTLLGGVRWIAAVSSLLVPFMALLYVGGAFVILAIHVQELPSAIWQVIDAAFSGQAASGGFAGASVLLAIQMGFSRGLMASESGMGSGAIAAAAAKTDTPARQAMVSMAGTFLGAFVMCTATALVLAVTGVVGAVNASGKVLTGAPMTVEAFNRALPGSGVIVTIGLVLFAFTTIVGWAYYGEKSIEYLVGDRFRIPYRLLFSLCVIPGALLDLHVVWRLADIGNALMVLPNLVALFALSGVVVRETHAFEALLKRE